MWLTDADEWKNSNLGFGNSIEMKYISAKIQNKIEIYQGEKKYALFKKR